MKSLACIALLVLAGLAPAKPPQAPPVKASGFAWAVTDRAPACANCPCGLDDCPCGCCEGKPCTCKKPAKKARVNELSKPYAAQWIVEGWTWDEAGGYWFKYPEPAPVQYQSYQPPAQQMQFMPMQSFGGFGGGRSFGGGGGRGGC